MGYLFHLLTPRTGFFPFPKTKLWTIPIAWDVLGSCLYIIWDFPSTSDILAYINVLILSIGTFLQSHSIVNLLHPYRNGTMSTTSPPNPTFSDNIPASKRGSQLMQQLYFWRDWVRSRISNLLFQPSCTTQDRPFCYAHSSSVRI